MVSLSTGTTTKKEKGRKKERGKTEAAEITAKNLTNPILKKYIEVDSIYQQISKYICSR